jgi:hypothetical protein
MQRMIFMMMKIVNKIGKYEYNKDFGERLCDHYIPFEGCNIFSKELWETFLYSTEGRRANYDMGIDLAKNNILRWRAKMNVVE